MAKRSSKTAAQQCRYYEVDNIFVYMVETYINGNISVFRELYRELNKDARRDFTDFLLSEVEPTYWREILKQTIWKIQCKLPPKTKRFCPLVLK